MKNKTITICCSASFVREVLEIQKKLQKLGFKAIVPKTALEMRRKNNYKVSNYKTWYKNPEDYKIKKALMDDHFKKVLKADAILVVNSKKNGLEGYIGGNALMEMTIGYYFKKPIFILNNISDRLSIKEEVFGINPIFLNGKIEDIKFNIK